MHGASRCATRIPLQTASAGYQSRTLGILCRTCIPCGVHLWFGPRPMADLGCYGGHMISLTSPGRLFVRLSHHLPPKYLPSADAMPYNNSATISRRKRSDHRSAFLRFRTINKARVALHILDGWVGPLGYETLHVGLSRPLAVHPNRIWGKAVVVRGAEAFLEDEWSVV